MEPANKTIIVTCIVGIIAAFIVGAMITDFFVTRYYTNEIDVARQAEQYLLQSTIQGCEEQGKQTVIKGAQYNGEFLNFDITCQEVKCA